MKMKYDAIYTGYLIIYPHKGKKWRYPLLFGANSENEFYARVNREVKRVKKDGVNIDDWNPIITAVFGRPVA